MKDDADETWGTIVKYNISPPTQTDWDLLATYYPLSTPEMKAVKNLNAEEWSKAGVTELQLAKLVKDQKQHPRVTERVWTFALAANSEKSVP